MKFKRFLCLVLCVCMSLTLFVGLADTASADDVIVHTVQNGEYLFKICKSYGLDYYQCKNAIMALNGFTLETQLNRLSVGQKIKLPASNALAASTKASTTTTTTVSTTIGGTTTTMTSTSTTAGVAATGYAVAFYLIPHNVKSGETLNDICNLYGTNYYTYSSMILAMNGIKNAASVWAGKTIYIPVSSAPSGGSFYSVIAHTVSSGENLTSICSKYGMNYGGVKTLVDGLNAGTNINSIKVGQIVYVPVTGAVGTTVSSGTSSTSTTSASAAVNTGFNIKFDSVIDGAPYATVNGTAVSRANAGTKVHVMGNSALGFSVQQIDVIRLDTNAKVDIANHEFTMPDSDVKITVKYSEAHRLVKQATTNGKFSCSVNGEIVGYAKYTDTVTVIPYPDENYVVKTDTAGDYQVYYKQESDPSKPKTYAKRNSDGTFSFSMPNYGVVVYVEFEQAEYFNITTDINAGSVLYQLNGVKITKAAYNTYITAKVTPNTGWHVTGVEVFDTSHNKLNAGLKKIDENTYAFTMPNKDVIVKFVLEYTIVHKITASKTTGGKISFMVQDLYTGAWSVKDTARAGETVRIVPTAEANYTYDGANVRYATSDAQVPVQNGNDGLTNYHYFIMPEADVVVNTAFKATSAGRRNLIKKETSHGRYEVYVLDDYSAYVPGTSALISSTVKIHVVPDDGYELESVVLRDASNGSVHLTFTSSSPGYPMFSFTMPSGDLIVEVTFKWAVKYVKLNIGNAKTDALPNGNIRIGTIVVKVNDLEIANGSELRSGAQIIMNLPSKAGYTLSYVEVAAPTGTYRSTTHPALVSALSATSYRYTIQDGDTSDVITGSPVTLTVSAIYVPNVEPAGIWDSNTDWAKGSYTVSIQDEFTGVWTKLADPPAVCTAYNGQKVKLDIKPDTGYTYDLMINDTKIDEADIVSDSYTFTMGTSSVKTEVVFK